MIINGNVETVYRIESSLKYFGWCVSTKLKMLVEKAPK